MKCFGLVFSASTWTGFGAVPANAHHSFAANFDVNADLELAGEVVTVRWRNPHIEFDIETEGGRLDDRKSRAERAQAPRHSGPSSPSATASGWPAIGAGADCATYTLVTS